MFRIFFSITLINKYPLLEKVHFENLKSTFSKSGYLFIKVIEKKIRNMQELVIFKCIFQ